MGKIKLLDCTLRDGGYINDWQFGKKPIEDMTEKLISVGVDILEIGFLKDEPYQEDRTVFQTVEQLSQLISPKKKGMEYAAMIEVINPLPLDRVSPRGEDTVDIIRVIVWKNQMQQGFEYCKGIVEKGYRLCVQPARFDQYAEQEFIDMIQLFNQLDPMAIYVVDSWGTQYEEMIIRYVDLADQHCKPGVALGYHGHNNMMQAFGVAQSLLEKGYGRDFIMDASVYGIGRGAGNLNTELIARYMNKKFGTEYKIQPMLAVYDQYLKDILHQTPWGYSLAFFLTAIHGCNPNYASYYDHEMKMDATEIEEILLSISEEDKIIYTQKKAEAYLAAYREKK